jgi:hypothetical protein
VGLCSWWGLGEWAEGNQLKILSCYGRNCGGFNVASGVLSAVVRFYSTIQPDVPDPD